MSSERPPLIVAMVKRLDFYLHHLRRRLKATIFDLVVNRACSSPLVGRRIRRLGYRSIGIDVRTIRVSPRCTITAAALSIGETSYINTGCFLESDGGIHIGEHCSLAMGVMLLTSDHEVGGGEKRAGKLVRRPVDIGDGCWIGARATILPGVTIEPGCVVAAGALVTSDCAANGLYAGVPAIRIRDLTI